MHAHREQTGGTRGLPAVAVLQSHLDDRNIVVYVTDAHEIKLGR